MTISHPLLAPIRQLHHHIRAQVVAATEQSAIESLAQVDHQSDSDTIYAVDRISETALVDFFEREFVVPLVLIAEGLPGGRMVLPRGAAESDARWRIIVDPIDGTRGLMFQKRSAWILTGVAPNRGPQTNLQDIELAVQTEIPLVKQHLCDAVWAVRGQGAQAERFNRLTGERAPLALKPSGATTIAHGFATVSRFFPGVRAELAALDDELVAAALGPPPPGKAHCFEDQYICSGGQLFELMAGHDRFVADLRPLLLGRRHFSGLCSHPYDLCTELIARELGVIVTTPAGGPLRAPLDDTTNVGWVGYANAAIHAQMEPLLRAALKSRNLLKNE